MNGTATFGGNNDLKSLDSQMGLIAKLKEIKEQLDDASNSSSSRSSQNLKVDEDEDEENENEDGSVPPSRQEPNTSDP